MKKRTSRDINEPIGRLRVMADFLPPPELLIPRNDTVKVTIAVDRETLKFFKASAQKTGLKYQRMIREVLNGYAKKYKP